MPVASGGIHAGQMHQLLDLFGDDAILQFGGGIDRASCRHSGGRRGQSRRARGDGEGAQRRARHPRTRGRTCWKRRRAGARLLKQALDTWRDVTFNYASTDTPDFAVTPTCCIENPSLIFAGASFTPFDALKALSYETFFWCWSISFAPVRGRQSLSLLLQRK